MAKIDNTKSIGASLLAKRQAATENQESPSVAEIPVKVEIPVQQVTTIAPAPVPKAKVAQKSSAAPISEGKKNGKQYTFVIGVDDLLTNSHKYKNSTMRLTIDEKYRNAIAMVAEYSKIDMAQLVNNMIGVFLNSEEVVQDLRKYCTDCQKERLNSLMDK
ncbi:MAG: hypothetical protein LBK47_08060 [Prevotellaceae bacterium]|jgi:hypothetical protein|nr:hypothetical protein [Prevotellaceae bacterium]